MYGPAVCDGTPECSDGEDEPSLCSYTEGCLKENNRTIETNAPLVCIWGKTRLKGMELRWRAIQVEIIFWLHFKNLDFNGSCFSVFKNQHTRNAPLRYGALRTPLTSSNLHLISTRLLSILKFTIQHICDWNLHKFFHMHWSSLIHSRHSRPRLSWSAPSKT